MAKNIKISNRKSEHIRINLEEDVQSSITTGFENYRFFNRALPELDLNAIDLSQTLFDKRLRYPILISSMTGGTEEALELNIRLAEAAQSSGIAMGLGSQRSAIENPELARTFKVRKYAPDILLFANIGAVQLNYGYSVEQCKAAVDMVQADALILHLNALQEAIQPEGDTNFGGLLKKIEIVCRDLPVPVIIKEVGWGISAVDARLLVNAGVAAIDVAGAGGTSWSQVEMYRIEDVNRARVAAAFRNWGIPTSESILQVREAMPEIKVFASGGIKDGVDIAKAVALGADLGGMAGNFLKAANISTDTVVGTIKEIAREIQITMFCVGAGDLTALKNTSLQKIA